jgi:pyridoxine 5-phosphate synthase
MIDGVLGMVRLSINIDHVASLRQARGCTEPDPVVAAMVCELAGADGITPHLRLDRRHIQDRDLRLLKQIVKTTLNLEMATTEEMLDTAIEVHPDLCTLVPERAGEITTEGGLDVASQKGELRGNIKRLHKAGLTVSIFVDPEVRQLEAAKEVGADAVELHTGPYAEAAPGEAVEWEFKRLLTAAEHAGGLGLEVRAGHSLNFRNLSRIAALPNLVEVSIGHNVVARSVVIGLERAVRELLAILNKQ